jgi:hypothetical protein
LSLFSPWTTLPAIIVVIGMIVSAAFYARKHPLLSFGILFYFLNHLVESSILPLELVFEHRNYLPSFFLFLPLAYGVSRLLTRYRDHRRSIFLLLVVLITAITTVMGLACYDRNKAWKSDYTLWYDAFKKAPGRSRAMTALGVTIGWGKESIPNRHDIAMNLFQRALTLPKARKNETAHLHGNIGLIHAAKGDLPQAIAAYRKALEISSSERKIRFDLVKVLSAIGQWQEAESQLDIMLSDAIATPSDLSYKGLINLWLQKPETALAIFQEVLQADYRDAFVYHSMAVAMDKMNYVDRGKWFLERALEIVEPESRGKLVIYLAMMENRNLANDPIGTKNAAYRLLAEFGLDEVLDTLRQLPFNHNFPPMDTESVSRILNRNLIDIARLVDVP